MDMLQFREKEVFETLKKIRIYRFVVIGGYAVNLYTLPRFSVDCDIVVEDVSESKKIEEELNKFGYKREKTNKIATYHDGFIRYKKEIVNNFKVSMDVLVNTVLDRQTKINFSAKWVFENSVLRTLKGKTISEKLKLRVINLDALIVMKSISCRSADIRDVFMLMPQAKDMVWIKEEISKRYDFKSRFEKIKEKIMSTQFKNNLQGVYGYIDKIVFEKHKNSVLRMGEVKQYVK